jgi:hypothetical protein
MRGREMVGAHLDVLLRKQQTRHFGVGKSALAVNEQCLVILV